MEKDMLEARVREHLENGEFDKIISALEELHPADISELLIQLDVEGNIKILKLLEIETAGQVLRELEPYRRVEILELLDSKYISRLMESIPAEDAADIFEDMSRDKAEESFKLMDEEEAGSVEDLLRYPPESAGGIMTPNVFSLNFDTRVEDAISALRRTTGVESVSYLYAVDSAGRLSGVVSLKDLITARGSVKLKEIMKEDVISAVTDMDQEEAARLVRKYDFRALPVIDENGVLVGRITADEVMDVIQEEADEDILRMAGLDDDQRLASRNILGIAGLRLPWLLSPLLAGLGAAYIIKGFEETLTRMIAVAFFIPVIMDMGGNVGTQSAAIVVRGIATGRIDLNHIWHLLYRELRIAMLIGIVCGAFAGLLGVVLHGNMRLGMVVMTSMFLALSVSSTIGAFFPVILKRFNVDPAIASGPFVTTINDILCLLIYFLLASRFLIFLNG